MCLSSQLPDLEWESTAETVVVALWDSYCDARFVEVTLRPHGGKVRLWELRESVERHMRAECQTRMNMRVLWKEPGAETWTSAPLRVFYCDKHIAGEAEQFLDMNFLSTVGWKPLPPPGETETLSFYERTTGIDVTPTFHVWYCNSLGEVCSAVLRGTTSLTSADRVMDIGFDVSSLQSRLEDVSELLSLTVRVGERTMPYYRTQPESNASFLFLNCFNVPEWARLTCSTVTKTNDERKLGRVGRRRVLYNPSREVLHEVQTAALEMDHAEWIDQLITSPGVWLADGTAVVITDGECAVSDDNGTLNSVKFTWQRNDGRAGMSVVERVDRIFTKEFTYQFT